MIPMLELDKHVVKSVFVYPDEDGKGDEWYELKHMPLDKIAKAGNDSEKFNKVVLNWGGIRLGGEVFECTEKNKEKFFNLGEATADRVAWIFETVWQRNSFSMNFEVYQERLGKLYNTSTNGKTSNQTPTTPIAENVEKS